MGQRRAGVAASSLQWPQTKEVVVGPWHPALCPDLSPSISRDVLGCAGVGRWSGSLREVNGATVGRELAVVCIFSRRILGAIEGSLPLLLFSDPRVPAGHRSTGIECLTVERSEEVCLNPHPRRLPLGQPCLSSPFPSLSLGYGGGARQYVPRDFKGQADSRGRQRVQSYTECWGYCLPQGHQSGTSPGPLG